MFRPKSGSSARSIRNLSQNEDPAVKSNTIERITDYIANYELPSPCLVLDVDAVEENYKEMARLFPSAKIYYAVKANPAEMLVKRLDQLGACFDTASPGEFDMCIRLGIAPSRISYGNTIKKQADIAYAYAQGIRLFAFDSENELEKISASAPGAQVYCRILVESGGAEWPLSRKFGCAPEMALELLIKAQELGLDAYGVSFHVGSQQVNLDRWEPAIAKVAEMFAQAKKRGVNLRLIDMGGGFPTHYRTDVEPIKSYAQKISAAMDKHFGTDLPDVILEPGRSLVGGAGIIQAEVVLISRKSAEEKTRWVYLDIGKFSGLAETMDEAIKYHIVTSRDGGPTGPVVLAGPTCDSADIMYEKTHYEMPLDLKEGDKVLILATGAYTTTYSSVNFNGFAPLGIVCI